MEDQIASGEADKGARPKRPASQQAREMQAQRDSLVLSRTEVLNRLHATRNDRYRAQLQLALEHIEGKLRDLDRKR